MGAPVRQAPDIIRYLKFVFVDAKIRPGDPGGAGGRDSSGTGESERRIA